MPQAQSLSQMGECVARLWDERETDTEKGTRQQAKKEGRKDGPRTSVMRLWPGLRTCAVCGDCASLRIQFEAKPRVACIYMRQKQRADIRDWKERVDFILGHPWQHATTDGQAHNSECDDAAEARDFFARLRGSFAGFFISSALSPWLTPLLRVRRLSVEKHRNCKSQCSLKSEQQSNSLAGVALHTCRKGRAQPQDRKRVNLRQNYRLRGCNCRLIVGIDAVYACVSACVCA